jgi:hypothetical protein
MAISQSGEQYRKLQRKRIKIIQRGKRKGPITAARYMAAQMRRLAPRKTGNLIRTIHRRKNSVEVSGVSKDGFPYIHWINETPGAGLEKINLARRPTQSGKWPRRSTRNRNPSKWTQLLAYRDCPNRTGEPRFFFIAQDLARERYRAAMMRNTRNALMAEF